MTSQTDRVLFIRGVPVNLHRRLRVLATQRDVSVSVVVIEALESYLPREGGA